MVRTVITLSHGTHIIKVKLFIIRNVISKMAKFEVRQLRDKSKILHISSGKQKYLRTKKVAIASAMLTQLQIVMDVIW